ncbi:MAG: hypothetical protein ACI9F2_001032, partial [Lysobacterales bacterium]
MKKNINLLFYNIIRSDRWSLLSSKGQSMLEYLLMFAAVVTVLITAIGPTGFLTAKFDQTKTSIAIAECMAISQCFDIACDVVCGNGCCESGEDASCPQDCGGVFDPKKDKWCGDGIPQTNENCRNCPADFPLEPCGSCGDGGCDKALGEEISCPRDCPRDPGKNCKKDGKVVKCDKTSCGDGTCQEDYEDCIYCIGDCGVCPKCGNGQVDGPEICDKLDRAKDCTKDGVAGKYHCNAECTGWDETECKVPLYCGDGIQSTGENCYTCPIDYGPCSHCGTNGCEISESETWVNCPEDCKDSPTCGNRKINDKETCLNCPADIGVCTTPVCGDKDCEGK